MDKLFLTILNMSLTGAFVIAAICVARLPLKKAPKTISYCLWAVAGFRLVFPYSIESVFSLIPFKAQTIPPDIAMQPIPRIDSGIPSVNNAVSSILPAATPTASVNPLQIWTTVGAWVWLVGVAALLIYGVVSFFILKCKMSEAAHIGANTYEAENIKSPFVLGVFKPKIYLPIGLSGQEKSYIILHEQTHIRRHDHIVKFAAYFVLCLHWFNPLAWVAFLLMGVDMEMSCDERVLKEMGSETKKDYSLSLLSLATERRVIGGSPLAFGEVGIKERVKNVLKFKKTSRLIIVVAVALVVVLSVGFAVNRAASGTTIHDLRYFDVNGFQLGGIIGGAANLTPTEPLAGNQYDFNFTEIRYSLDEYSGKIRKMMVYVHDNGVKCGFNTGLYEVKPWNTIEQVIDFFGNGKHGWQDREQRLRYVEYTQKEGRLSAIVRFVYAADNRLVWVIAESSLPYPSSTPAPTAWKSYGLENATERQRMERMTQFTLYEDGTMSFAQPMISSYIPPHCTYSIENGEMVFRAIIKTEHDKGFYGLENGDIVARFTLIDENTLVFHSSEVALFAEPNGRYVAVYPDGATPVLPISSYKPQKWVDFYRDEELPWTSTYDLMLDEFPGVLFSWTSEKVTATDADGTKALFWGMPVWNVYLADLNGDGLPELCATCGFGSGIYSQPIIVHDYANNQQYALHDRGEYDYALSLENERLVVTQTRSYMMPGSEEITGVGSFAIINSELVIFGLDRTVPIIEPWETIPPDTTPQETNPPPTNSQYEIGSVTVVSNGREYVPYTHMLHSETNTEHGFISADGEPLSLEDVTRSLPEIRYDGNFQVSVTGEYATILSFSVYDSNFELFSTNKDGFVLPDSPGVYTLCVDVAWSDVEIDSQYREYKANRYVFKIVRPLPVPQETTPPEYSSHLSSWRPLHDLPADYSKEQAIADGVHVNIHGLEIYNQALVDRFYADVSAGGAAFMRVMQYTIEGDVIITDYQYDGSIFTVNHDTTRDKFGNNGISTMTYKYLVLDDKSGSIYHSWVLSNEENIYAPWDFNVIHIGDLWWLPQPSDGIVN